MVRKTFVLPEHGTKGRYRDHGCRCDSCCYANTIAVQESRKERHQRILDGTADVVHGTSTVYTNWCCRCKECRQWSADNKESRKRAR